MAWRSSVLPLEVECVSICSCGSESVRKWKSGASCGSVEELSEVAEAEVRC